VRLGIDVTPLRLTRAGTARYLRGLLEQVTTCHLDVRRLAFGGAGRASVLARELVWYPFVLGTAGGIDVLHCPTYYVPLRQRVPRGMGLLVRTAVEPTSVAAAVQREIGALDRALAGGDVRTLDRLAADALAPQRVTFGMAGIFAAIALVLAVVGVYGVMAFTVTQRTREIGVRIALGAMPRDVVRMIVRRGLALALAGVALGVAGALAMGRSLGRLLHGVSPTDPLTLGGVTLALTAVALLASYLPARRAARVDPMVALRAE
jgi:putative ABC transport system permease protein